MSTRELIACAIILVAAVALFLAMIGQAGREIGIVSSGICVAIPALLGYLEMRKGSKARQNEGRES